MSESLSLYYKILRRRIADFWREFYRRIEREDLVDELPEVLAEEFGVQLDHDLAVRLLDELSKRDRELVVLKEIYGMTYEELSKRFSAPRGTLLKSVFLIKKQLRARAERLGKVNL